jgi:hypothetical protein
VGDMCGLDRSIFILINCTENCRSHCHTAVSCDNLNMLLYIVGKKGIRKFECRVLVGTCVMRVELCYFDDLQSKLHVTMSLCSIMCYTVFGEMYCG